MYLTNTNNNGGASQLGTRRRATSGDIQTGATGDAWIGKVYLRALETHRPKQLSKQRCSDRHIALPICTYRVIAIFLLFTARALHTTTLSRGYHYRPVHSPSDVSKVLASYEDDVDDEPGVLTFTSPPASIPIEGWSSINNIAH
jgi:hypothetical protein